LILLGSSWILAGLTADATAAPGPLGLQRGMLLEEAITELENAGLTVFYSSDLIKPWSRVNVEPTAEQPPEALRQILAPLGLTTQPGPNGAVLVIRDRTDAAAYTATGGLAGVARERGDGGPLAGAAVSLLQSSRRTVTGSDGRFAFPGLAAGSYRVLVRYPANGFETTADVEVKAQQTTFTYVDVDATSRAALEEIVVAASRYELSRSGGFSLSSLTGEDLEYLPDFGDDALRAVARLPGTATNGVSAQSNVRGGEVGETLVRFDGLRLYNPFHLKRFQSIFSTVDPRLVSSIDVYTGGFPATFGDRMSSVVDIVSLDAPDDRYHEFALSFFNTSALSAGRFDEGNGDWLASVRRSNLDVLFDSRSSHAGQPRYLDSLTKLSYRINETLRVTGNYLYFRDEIELADADGSRAASATDDEHYVWLRLDHTPRSGLTGATLVASSELESHRSGTVEDPGVGAGNLDDRRDIGITALQSDWQWQHGESMLLQFGAGLSRSRARYDYRDEAEFDALFAVPGTATETSRSRAVRLAPRGHQYGAYASLRYSPNRLLATDFGLRWDKQTLDPGHSESLSPRLGARLRLAQRTFLRASIGRFYQSQTINELQVEDGIEEFFEPQQADHLVIGLEHGFEDGLSLRIEAYEKEMSRLRPRFENLLDTLALLPELKPDRIRIDPTSARARGLEVLLSRQLQYPLTWWLGYSRSWVEDRIGDEQIPRSWDQAHAISAGLNWDTPQWNFGIGLIYRSGWPTTPVALEESEPIPIVGSGSLNSARIGDFQSVDMRVTRKFAFERSALSVFLEINNLFDRDNPCCIEYEILDEDEGGGLELKTLNYLPRIPSIGFVWSF
jgi:hypothetical protein